MAINQASIYGATDAWPAHLSVGAVLINAKQQVALHYHPTSEIGEVYLLVRETLHNNETLEAGVARGLLEELGASGKIVAYLDSLRCVLNESRVANGRLMHKTTLYFLVELTEINPDRRDTSDREGQSEIVWLDLDKAQTVMQLQAMRLPQWLDLDEASVIATAKDFLAKNT